ncbi:MAG: glycosyltransferase family 4 protein [Candidatus Saccharicenans sp.]|nr:glycosyltransferase family 4 protein [Candidatus Saccharicenans sp.]
MRKVVHITTVHSPFDARVFHKEAKTLVQAGYDVTLIAQHDKNEVVDGVKIIPLPKSRNRLQRMLGLTSKAFHLAFRQRADIYHFHDPELIPIGMLLTLVTKAKVIYDVHEDYVQHMLFKEWFPSSLRRIASWFMWQIEKISARSFAAIITPTDAITERFQKLRARKVRTLHNFPLLEFGSANSHETVLTLQFDLIHTGTLSSPRLSFMFSVARELKQMGYNFKWCILGASPEMIKWAESEMKKEGPDISENFVFIEKVPHTVVCRYLLQSKIGVNHHLAEPRFLAAIPVKVFEYMACGLPVISSDLPLLRKLLGGKNCAILVRPGDVGAFANSVKYLLDNPVVAGEMGTKGMELIKEKYNWEKEEENLLSLYQELLEEEK